MKAITITVLAVSLVAALSAAWAADAPTRTQRAKTIYTNKAQALTPRHHVFAERKGGYCAKAAHVRAHGAKRIHAQKQAVECCKTKAACCEKAAACCDQLKAAKPDRQ